MLSIVQIVAQEWKGNGMSEFIDKQAVIELTFDDDIVRDCFGTWSAEAEDAARKIRRKIEKLPSIEIGGEDDRNDS